MMAPRIHYPHCHRLFNEDQLAAAAQCRPARAARWYPHLITACVRFNISTRKRAAAFIAQIAHESAGLRRIEENLSYSAGRLLEVFPSYFTPDTARDCARQPEQIANTVYANRLGNGPARTGDGYRYRGRGLIQITGRNNYRWIGGLLGIPLEDQPALLIQLDYAAASAAAYWHGRGLNALADDSDIVGITRRINGGRNGLDDRIRRWRVAKDVLGVA